MPTASSQSPLVSAHDAPGPQPQAIVMLPVSAGGARAWVRALRVRQWTKNLLVLAAPAAAGVLGNHGVLWRVAVAVLTFCFLASGAYLINDVWDAAEDRRHPTKRHRPIACGVISPTAAVTVGAGLILIGLGLSLVVSVGLFATACGYVALNAAYTGWLRRIPVVDIVAIAAAFVLRALAGAVAAQVPVSRWFIVFVSCSALFVAAGKRYADLLDPAARKSRRVLQNYSAGFLRLVIAVSWALALATYFVWALQGHRAGSDPWRELSLVPLALVTLRYLAIVSQGAGGAPERVLFSDRFVQLAGAIWLAMFAVGV